MPGLQPRRFGRYLLIDEIGTGGMAEVFLAKASGVAGFEKTLAIKRVLASVLEDSEFQTMFVDEAQISANLNHVNIGQIFEFGEIDGSYFIAMEYVPGRDLRAIRQHFEEKDGYMPVSIALHVMARVCQALDYAHRHKDADGNPMQIVHRDVSPPNVIISFGGEVKLIDFGIAKAATRLTRTRAGKLKGKFSYMSPEQIAGKEIDHRSDIFSVGILLYEILTNQRPFDGPTHIETLKQVRNVDPDPPSTLNPEVPLEVDRIVMQALSKKPEDRYGWASEMRADVERFFARTEMQVETFQVSEWIRSEFGEAHKEYLRLMQIVDRLKVEDFPEEEAEEEQEEGATSIASIPKIAAADKAGALPGGIAAKLRRSLAEVENKPDVPPPPPMTRPPKLPSERPKVPSERPKGPSERPAPPLHAVASPPVITPPAPALTPPSGKWSAEELLDDREEQTEVETEDTNEVERRLAMLDSNPRVIGPGEERSRELLSELPTMAKSSDEISAEIDEDEDEDLGAPTRIDPAPRGLQEEEVVDDDDDLAETLLDDDGPDTDESQQAPTAGEIVPNTGQAFGPNAGHVDSHPGVEAIGAEIDPTQTRWQPGPRKGWTITRIIENLRDRATQLSSTQVIAVVAGGTLLLVGLVVWIATSVSGGQQDPPLVTGSLLIETTPRAACTVSIDKTKRLLSPDRPLKLLGLQIGTHTVHLTCAGFKPHDEQVEINPGKVTYCEAKLIKE